MGNECECDPCHSEEFTSKNQFCLKNANLNVEEIGSSIDEFENKIKNYLQKEKLMKFH